MESSPQSQGTVSPPRPVVDVAISGLDQLQLDEPAQARIMEAVGIVFNTTLQQELAKQPVAERFVTSTEMVCEAKVTVKWVSD